MDERLMMRPQPRSHIFGSAALVSTNGASSMSVLISRQSSIGNSVIGWILWMPALLTRMSTSRSTPSSAEVSARLTVQDRPPISAATDSADSASTSATTTWAPASAKARLIALPSPEAPPVTSARRFASSAMRCPFRDSDQRCSSIMHPTAQPSGAGGVAVFDRKREPERSHRRVIASPSVHIAERSGDSAANLVGMVERAQVDALRLTGEQEGDERHGCCGGQVDRNGHRGVESLQQRGGDEGGERSGDDRGHLVAGRDT